MAVGDSALLGGVGYVAIGRETTTGTYNTCTAALDVLSFGVVTTQENKILEQVERSRTYSKRVQQTRNVGGPMSFYFAPDVLACNYVLHQAMNATITTATVTGETTGGGGFQHTLEIGNVDASYPSLCMNVRKGDGTAGKIFEYTGVRVGDINFAAQIDEPLQVDVNFMGIDASVGGTDVESALTVTSAQLLNFTDGRVSLEQSFASLTSSSFWHVQSVEWGWNNNLKSDQQVGRIGSALKQVLPNGIVQFTAKATIRFNTTSAYDSMIAASALAMQLEFLGDTISGSVARRGIRFNFPRVYISNAGDPVINGPNELLTSEVEFHVLRDDSSASGYAMQAIVYNTTSSYA